MSHNPQDCNTGRCASGLCVQPTTCTNRVKDGSEGDVDCGGLCDRQCGTGSTCGDANDCISNVCTGGRCVNAPTCSNGIKDARETDVDWWVPTDQCSEFACFQTQPTCCPRTILFACTCCSALTPTAPSASAFIPYVHACLRECIKLLVQCSLQ